MKYFCLFTITIIFFSCFHSNNENAHIIDKKIEEIIHKYVNDNDYKSFFITSSCNLFSEKKYSGILIGPMYEGLFYYFDNLSIQYYDRYGGKTIYIDSVTFFDNNKSVSLENINYCKQDSFLLYQSIYGDIYEYNSLVNYIKRAILINISSENNDEKIINILNADTIFLPDIKEDNPLNPE